MKHGERGVVDRKIPKPCAATVHCVFIVWVFQSMDNNNNNNHKINGDSNCQKWLEQPPPWSDSYNEPMQGMA
jgi:hypothetical protein